MSIGKAGVLDFDAADPACDLLADHLEDEDGGCVYPELSFCLARLKSAMLNAYHDAYGYAESLLDD